MSKVFFEKLSNVASFKVTSKDIKDGKAFALAQLSGIFGVEGGRKMYLLNYLGLEHQDESPMPYLFDIVDYTHLEHKELKEHIDRIGKMIYEK